MAPSNYSLLAAAAGIISSTVFFTMNSTIVYIAMPSYQLPRLEPEARQEDRPESSTDLILRQWELTYSRGHWIGPASALFSPLAYICAAQTSPQSQRSLYYIAAACAGAAFPFTVLFMLSINNELYRRAHVLRIRLSGDKNMKIIREKSRLDASDSLVLIRKCLFLSRIRAWMPFPAIVLALYAISRQGTAS